MIAKICRAVNSFPPDAGQAAVLRGPLDLADEIYEGVADVA
jgi:hypothetical protein